MTSEKSLWLLIHPSSKNGKIRSEKKFRFVNFFLSLDCFPGQFLPVAFWHDEFYFDARSHQDFTPTMIRQRCVWTGTKRWFFTILSSSQRHGTFNVNGRDFPRFIDYSSDCALIASFNLQSAEDFSLMQYLCKLKWKNTWWNAVRNYAGACEREKRKQSGSHSEYSWRVKTNKIPSKSWVNWTQASAPVMLN